MKSVEWMAAAADRLAVHSGSPRVWVGFDGFVDKILHLVDERQDQDHYRRIENMADFAGRVAQAAGYSANIEMVPQTVKLGGNGPILADGLRHLGCRVTYAGAIGHPDIHPVFKEFADACERVISLAEPASTDALEFADGKLLMGQMLSLREVNWDRLLQAVPCEELADWIGGMELVAAVNWTMLPAMNGLLEGLHAILQGRARRPLFFVDLTDPRKRSRADLREALAWLTRLQQRADVVLGMNEQESAQVEEALFGQAAAGVARRAARLHAALKIHWTVIHPVRTACVASADGVVELYGPYTSKPRLTTGAGDTFNAGLCRALLAGCSPGEAIGAGACASGFYVQQARAPGYEEWIDFMRQWPGPADGESA
jgi:hypothetical protein